MKLFTAKADKMENGKWITDNKFQIFHFPLSVIHFILRLCVSAVQIFLILSLVSAQSGVLLPSPANKPNPRILSLAVMNVEITIDNQHATVKIMQIFDNHTAQILEGKYVFALPQKSSISDFAVWDGDLRIPGVMMERRRANQIYGSIKERQTDPGILQTTDETESAAGFSAKIFPINSFGTKRLEMEYTEDLAIENLTSHFTFPLKPSYGERQTVGEFNLKIRIVNDFQIAPVLDENSPFPLQIQKNEPNEFVGEFRAQNIELSDDFSFTYQINAPENALSIIAYRAPERISAYDLRDPNLAESNPDGFFQANAIFAQNPNTERQPKRVVLLLDTSLSMYGDKLARAVEATDFFLHNLAPEDEFNLILFNQDTLPFSPKPVSATPENIENSLQFVKNSSLSGGTNLKKALKKSIEQSAFFSGGERQIVLVSDANPTLKTTLTREIEGVFDRQNVRLFTFALGADTNVNLLKSLTEKTRGYFDTARETEDIALKLKLFFEKVGTHDISNLSLSSPDGANLYDVYASGENSFFGSGFSFVGRYKKAQPQIFNLSAQFGTQNINLSRQTNLPDLDETHQFLPRVWARARVNALLQAMNRSGEREDYISEIIRLSEKYKFVTPYTAFLAAPRALLRPRLIQPGDPVIRVKTDESVKEVFAVLPFGETLPLKFLESEGVWETRFLAPAWMADGTYKCRLLLTDKNGNGYQEEKTFVVDSRAPKVKINLEKRIFQAGETVNLKVSADSDTNSLVAKFYGAKPVQLFWSNQEKASIGKLQIPETIASGKYVLRVTAEDFAHNQTMEEIQIEVLGK
ncbi:MAG TPA: VIT and VWA domain-containing protein [Pyrinomonadaceae bacterium]|nr:VIT and VWA domain-containing protein [Pyrinomonadaceae bacterium]